MSAERIKLTENFYLHEFRCPCGKGCEQAPAIVKALKRLCVRRLEPLRAACGHRKMTIHSGYRCAKANKASGGAGRSFHMAPRAKGSSDDDTRRAAADVIVDGVDPREVAKHAAEIAKTHGNTGGFMYYVDRAPGKREFCHNDDRDWLWDGNE